MQSLSSATRLTPRTPESHSPWCRSGTGPPALPRCPGARARALIFDLAVAPRRVVAPQEGTVVTEHNLAEAPAPSRQQVRVSFIPLVALPPVETQGSVYTCSVLFSSFEDACLRGSLAQRNASGRGVPNELAAAQVSAIGRSHKRVQHVRAGNMLSARIQACNSNQEPEGTPSALPILRA